MSSTWSSTIRVPDVARCPVVAKLACRASISWKWRKSAASLVKHVFLRMTCSDCSRASAESGLFGVVVVTLSRVAASHEQKKTHSWLRPSSSDSVVESRPTAQLPSFTVKTSTPCGDIRISPVFEPMP